MNFEEITDKIQSIALKIDEGAGIELEGIIKALYKWKESNDFLNDIDETNAIEVLETAYDYVPGNYRVVLVNNINAEQELKDFVKEHPFMDLLREY